MKERPILFSGPMVRAILEGHKTQTRRMVKKALMEHFDPPRGEGDVKAGYPWICGYWEENVSAVNVCPYGQPGDGLWVRETWRASWTNDDEAPSEMDMGTDIRYEADGFETLCGNYAWSKKVRPSIFMPRWASRILLEVTVVRVERLQDISEDDAMAEGVEYDQGWEEEPGWGFRDYSTDSDFVFADARHSYRSLWESINGPQSWDANPWVWVVEFKRVSP
jgi:hypothetical protein